MLYLLYLCVIIPERFNARPGKDKKTIGGNQHGKTPHPRRSSGTQTGAEESQRTGSRPTGCREIRSWVGHVIPCP